MVHIGNLSDNDVLEFSNPGCTSCSQMCRQSKSISIQLPASELPKLSDSGQVELGMNTQLQMRILFNSILLPLIGFVLGAFLSDALQFNDFGALACSFAGLFIGIFLCRGFSYSNLLISDSQTPTNSERLTSEVKPC